MRGRDDEVGLRFFSDADFGQHDDRKSFTGYVCMLGPNLIDWRSRKQTLVTTSTAEAELVAMDKATEDLEWKCWVAEGNDKRSRISYPPLGLPVRNQEAEARRSWRKGKLLDIRANAVADRMERSLVSLFNVPTDDNVAGMLTKSRLRHYHRLCLDVQVFRATSSFSSFQLLDSPINRNMLDRFTICTL